MDNDIKSQIGERIRNLRVASNKTLKDVSQTTGISERVLCGIEKGEHNINGMELLALASCFKRTTNYLIMGYNDPNEQNKNP